MTYINRMPISSSHQVDLAAPFRWLSLGWKDFVRNPVPGLVHGAAMALFGAVLLWFARDRFWLLAGAFSGFMIVAPILSTGLYLVSRECAKGQCVGMAEVVRVWRSLDNRLLVFGLLLGLAATGWVLTSAALITAWSPVPIQKPADFVRYVVLSPSVGLFEAWLLLGGFLAAPVFASSVVAIPMLVDRPVGVREAVMTSWAAVGASPLPLALWAALIMLITGVAMASALLGLVVAVPDLGHASWHAYLELTETT
jgi:uncharacterized membrane protein